MANHTTGAQRRQKRYDAIWETYYQQEREKLIQSANKSARSRGHILGAWCGDRETRTAGCTLCGKTATIRTVVAANEIDISGEAIALNCVAKRNQVTFECPRCGYRQKGYFNTCPVPGCAETRMKEFVEDMQQQLTERRI